MNKVKYLCVQAAVLGMRLIYGLMKRCLKVRNKVVFISRQSDKPSIDILLMRETIHVKSPDTKVVVLARQMHNKVLYLFHILRQMWHIASAKTVVLDSYCIPVSVLEHRDGLTIIQMWHSIGSMKKFGYAMLGEAEGSDPEIARILCMHKNYTWILISSFSYLKDYIEGFRTDGSNVLEIPLPRADLLRDEAFIRKRREEIKQKHFYFQNKINIVYAPTFRKQPTEQDQESIRELIDRVDFRKYNLIYKPHPVSTLEVHDPRVIVSDMNNIDMLAVADVVITDYSSIIYEAGLVGRPVYLYAYDWETYKEKRFFNLDLEKDVPALFTPSAAEILNAIERQEFDHEGFQAFTKKNVHLPASCRQAMYELMKL